MVQKRRTQRRRGGNNERAAFGPTQVRRKSDPPAAVKNLRMPSMPVHRESVTEKNRSKFLAGISVPVVNRRVVAPVGGRRRRHHTRRHRY